MESAVGYYTLGETLRTATRRPSRRRPLRFAPFLFSTPAGGGDVAIAVVGNSDGTATVTITGGEAGAVNTVYVATADNLWGLIKLWREVGSRTGPGAVTVTTGRGAFFVQVSSDVEADDSVRIATQNNQDGTITVAITGVGVTDDVTVRYAPVDDTFAPAALDWTDGGSRTGPGSVDVTTGAGAFYLYAESDDMQISPPEFVFVSDGVETVWTQILEAVQARVRSIGLTGIASDRVLVLTELDPHAVKQIIDSTGGVVIAPGGPEQYRDGEAQTDDLDYPVVIAACVAARRDPTNESLRERWLMHRQRIRQALLNQPLAVPDAAVFNCTLRTAPPVDRAAWANMRLISPVALSFWSNEGRGI